MTQLHHTLELHVERADGHFVVALRHDDPDSAAATAAQRARTELDLDALLAEAHDPAAYGRLLWQQLFADRGVAEAYSHVRGACRGAMLRVVLHIDPSAHELHSVRWELLRDPDDRLVATQEDLPLSRFLPSRDRRPVKLRPRKDLKALLAVSAPQGRMPGGLAEVDRDGEVSRATAALGELSPTALEVCTLDALVDALRDGVDILYVVAHGMIGKKSGEPSLLLQKPDGTAAFEKGDALAERIADLPTRPRLVVLASCESAGDGFSGRAHDALAILLADAGVPAILAMNGQISMDTVEAMMPVFFTELLRDGQIDRALAVARGAVRKADDAWMPALYLRLKAGRIWYVPGFGSGDEAWKQILTPLSTGAFVPVLGSGLVEDLLGSHEDAARALAADYGLAVPEHEEGELSRVAQYLSVLDSRDNVVAKLLQHYDATLTKLQGPSDDAFFGHFVSAAGALSTRDDDPYRILAEDFRAEVYVTTNHVPRLKFALEGAGRKPTSQVSRWRHGSAVHPPPVSLAGHDADKPVIYYAFGSLTDNASLVLTEDDHFGYLIGTAADKLMPPEVASALVRHALVFLGFHLTDWSFRVLFRLLANLEGQQLRQGRRHVAVQVDPDAHTLRDARQAQRYLDEYLASTAKIDVFWGTAGDFLSQLRDELRKQGTPTAPAPADVPDGWV